jgi:hypothetical protein
MAIKNRTEAITEVNNVIVPTVTNAAHRTLLNESILNSVVFEKDVIASETPVAGAVTIDYANKDLATVTTAVDLAVSFTNLENGAVKYLEVTKAAANVISFVGALDIVQNRYYVNTVLTSICYRISNKNGIVRVEGMFAPSTSTFQTLSIYSGFTGTVKYRENLFTGKIEIELDLTLATFNSSAAFLLPSGIKPNRDLSFTPSYVGAIGSGVVSNPLTGIIYTSTGIAHIHVYNQLLVAQRVVCNFDYYKTLP